jgi:integrase
MSVNWDTATQRWRWQFKAIVGGRRYRLSKSLPRGWSEAAARKFDQQETARTYASLVANKQSAPLIAAAIDVYLREQIPEQADGRNAALNLVHLLPSIEGKTLEQLGEVTRAYLKANPTLAPATIRQRLATLRSAANYALKHHSLGSTDWIAAMSMPKVDNARTRYITRAELLAIARACNHPATRAWILLTFATGSRPGELVQAEARGDHFAKRLKNGEWQLMPVPARFRRYMRYWPVDYDYSTLSRHFRAAIKRAGFEDLKPHDLRHSTASELLKRGASLGQIGEVLNHKSSQATKRYVHLDTTRKLAALEQIFAKRVGE